MLDRAHSGSTFSTGDSQGPMTPPPVAQTAEPIVIPRTEEPISDSLHDGTPVKPSMSPNARSHTLDKPEPKRRGTSWFNRSPPAGPAENGGGSDAKALKRRHSGGLSMPKPLKSKKSEDNIKRRFSLGRRASENGTKTPGEFATESDKKPNWASKMFRLGSKSKKEKADELLMTPDSVTVDENSTQPAEELLEPPRPSITIPNAFGPDNRPLSVIKGSPVDPLNSRDQGENSTTGPPQAATDVGPEQATDSGPPPRPTPARSPESSGEQTGPSNTGLDQTTHNVISSLQSSAEVIARLEERGCANLSTRLNLETCSQHPVFKGGYGDVYSCNLHDQAKVAIKTLRPYEADNLPAGKYQKRIAKELYTWSKCNHPNVTKLLGFAEFQGYLAIVSEWAENGNLLSYIRKNPDVNRYSLSTSVCEGLVYLHENKFVHGDLKGANVLVSSAGIPMLTDFGNASLSDSTMSFTATGNNSLSFRWTAPEIIDSSSPHSRAGDVYALGMTILETLTGQIPFSEVRQDVQIVRIVVDKKETPPRPEEVPQSAWGNDLWELLMSCWNRDARLRPSAAQVRDTMKTLAPMTLAQVEA